MSSVCGNRSPICSRNDRESASSVLVNVSDDSFSSPDTDVSRCANEVCVVDTYVWRVVVVVVVLVVVVVDVCPGLEFNSSSSSSFNWAMRWFSRMFSILCSRNESSNCEPRVGYGRQTRNIPLQTVFCCCSCWDDSAVAEEADPVVIRCGCP